MSSLRGSLQGALPLPPGVIASTAASPAGSAPSSMPPSARISSARLGSAGSVTGGVKLPLIRNAADAKEAEEEAAARAAAKKPKAALTPAEKRAAKLRREQAREEAEAAKKLKERILAEKKAARLASATSSQPGTSRGSGEGSLLASASPSGRQSSEGLRPGTDGAASAVDDVEFIENEDGTFTAHTRQPVLDTTAADDEADEAAAALEAEELKPAQENYDIIFDGPKSPLIMATAARQLHEMMRLIQEVPIEYRVEFVNAYDDHGCSAIFFAIGPEHQECMQLLLDYGADPNFQNNKKNGPLHIACAIQNKKACRILIEHGANIMLENWQYQKPHEMVTERDKVSSTQAFLNLCVETLAEKVANKELYGNITRHCRSYYRSIYDIADVAQLGVLKYDVVDPLCLINDPLGSGALLKADVQWVFGFFKAWDIDKNGVISFPEFLHRIVTTLNEREKLRKKLKRRQMLAAKRKKKREAAIAEKAASAAAARAVQQPPPEAE